MQFQEDWATASQLAEDAEKNSQVYPMTPFDLVYQLVYAETCTPPFCVTVEKTGVARDTGSAATAARIDDVFELLASEEIPMDEH